MPTIHQLIKKGRKKGKKAKKTVALQFGFNVLKNRPSHYYSPFKRGVCIKVFTQTPKKDTGKYKKRICSLFLADCHNTSSIAIS